jgi:acetoin utilization deacetylase AcuC-like enzyme
MIVLHDPRCADYEVPGHPEQPARVRHTAEHLRAAHPDWRWIEPGDVSEDLLLLAHTRALLQRLQAGEVFDQDTPLIPDMYARARASVAAAVEAARLALKNGEKTFSLMRPPGHHATAGQAMGFCYLNQVAVAAFAARAFGAARVAVWDFDAHHGNGTEAILDGRPGFFFCSVHQFPGYPGTGTRNTPTCRNWSVSPHCPRERHLEVLRQSWDQVLAFRPELVLLSAGFDGYAHDPVASLSLEPEDFVTMGRWVREAGLPTAGVLEGGYSAELPRLVDGFLSAWCEA